ncbi:MAG: hypothetical protein CVV44_04455 [Spirochaetae bacterium HGW-Spirochaetae-1]|jgi:hypothetical protein|nr:MAG: hypothetical protein CVV44_04455 [Spirochaetae bacterium HGW-Spirochaetae-1]
MNTENQSNSLLIRIKDAIKSFVDNDISVSQAKSAYRSLMEEYAGFEKTPASEDKGSYIKGIFYHHTVNNFAKLTALFEKIDGKWSPVIFTGNDNLIPVAETILESGRNLIKNDTVTSLPISGDDRLSYILLARYLHPVEKSRIIATISSSSYFSSSAFEYFCDMIRSVLVRSLKFPRNVSLDLYAGIGSELKNIIASFLESDMKVTAHIYRFESFTDTFAHMGIKTIADVSEEIYHTLYHYHNLDSVIYILSLSKYIVIVPHDSSLESADSPVKSKIHFIYDGILLKFRTMAVEIKNSSDIYTIWQNLSADALL